MKYEVVVMPLRANRFKLVSKLEITELGVSVPAGYTTNGADVPRWLWWFVPPFKPKYLPAVIVHDYYCDLEEYSKADYVFEKVLLNIETSFTTRTMVYFVKLYHRVKYGVK